MKFLNSLHRKSKDDQKLGQEVEKEEQHENIEEEMLEDEILDLNADLF